MSYITISKASELLTKNKKTLFRWDKEGRFSPATREKVSQIRLYEESDVINLKVVLNHEERFQKNLKEIKRVRSELSNYMTVFLLSEKEQELQVEEQKL